MEKGQMGIAIMLVVGVIGLVIIADVGGTITTPTVVTNESLSTNAYTDTTYTLANTCGVDITKVYVNSTAFTNYTDNTVTRSATTITLGTLGANNNTAGTVSYTHGCSYNENSMVRMIVENIPILFAVGLLTIAVGYAVMK